MPEYESLYNAYPRSVRQKEWDFGVYRFITPRGGSSWFSLDVGTIDDLHVVRFHAKERHQNQTTFRWSRDVSYVSLLVGAPDASLLTLWMSDGGRPAQAGPTQVKVTLDDQPLGPGYGRDGLSAVHVCPAAGSRAHPGRAGTARVARTIEHDVESAYPARRVRRSRAWGNGRSRRVEIEFETGYVSAPASLRSA